MAATIEAVSTASVLASLASTPRRMEARHQRGGHEGIAIFEPGEARPIGEQHRGDRADERGNAVKPDGGPRGTEARGFGKRDARALQPINADRLLVARLVLKTDRDEIPGLQHLLRGLGETRLVAIHRRQAGKARQEHQAATRRRAPRRQARASAKAPPGSRAEYRVAPSPWRSPSRSGLGPRAPFGGLAGARQLTGERREGISSRRRGLIPGIS